MKGFFRRVSRSAATSGQQLCSSDWQIATETCCGTDVACEEVLATIHSAKPTPSARSAMQRATSGLSRMSTLCGLRDGRSRTPHSARISCGISSASALRSCINLRHPGGLSSQAVERMSTDAHGAAPAAGYGDERASPAEPAGGGTGKRRVREEADAVGEAAKEKQRSVCPHQRKRSQCKEFGGAGLCPHQRQRSQCKECGGAGICPHQRQRPSYGRDPSSSSTVLHTSSQAVVR